MRPRKSIIASSATAAVAFTLLAATNSRAEETDVLAKEPVAKDALVHIGPAPLAAVDPDARLTSDLTHQESLIEDAYSAAEQSNEPAARIADRFLDQDVLSEYTTHLIEAYPSQFAGAWYADGSFHVRFKADVPPEAVETLPADLRIFHVKFHTNTGHSLVAAYEAQEDVTDELIRLGASGWYVSYDPVDARVEVQLAPSEPNVRSLKRSTAAAAPSFPVDVSVGVSETVIDFQHH